MAIVTRSNPDARSWRMTMSRIGRSPTGISGLGSTVVYGRRRVPCPPARMIARRGMPVRVWQRRGSVRFAPVRVLMIEQGGRGGVTDYAEQLVLALAREGVTVELATRDRPRARPSCRGCASMRSSPTCGATSAPRRAARRLKLHWAYNAVGYLVGVARLLPAARRCRVVHFQGFRFPALTAFAMLAFRAVGARIVHTPHNTFERDDNDPATGRGWMEALPARVIVHSHADLDTLPERVRAKATVIPLGEYSAVAQTGGTPDRAACPAPRSASATTRSRCCCSVSCGSTRDSRTC